MSIVTRFPSTKSDIIGRFVVKINSLLPLGADCIYPNGLPLLFLYKYFFIISQKMSGTSGEAKYYDSASRFNL